jgi:hypothetical protein
MYQKHLSFYMTEIDEVDYISFALKTGDILPILCNDFDDNLKGKNKYEIYQNKEDFFKITQQDSKSKLDTWLFLNKDLSKMLRGDNTNFNDHYFIYSDPNNVIVVYNRCRIIKNIMNEGGLLLSDRYLESSNYNKTIDKLINSWFNKIRNWIKNNGVKATWDGIKPVWNTYILNDAITFFDKGGQLGGWRDPEQDVFDQSLRPFGNILVRDLSEPYHDLLLFLRNRCGPLYCQYKNYLCDMYGKNSYDMINVIKYIGLTESNDVVKLIVEKGSEFQRIIPFPVTKLEIVTCLEFKSEYDASNWLYKFVHEFKYLDSNNRNNFITKYSHLWLNNNDYYDLHTTKAVQDNIIEWRIWDRKNKRYLNLELDNMLKVALYVKMKKTNVTVCVLDKFRDINM